MVSSLLTHAMLISFVVASPLPQLPGVPGGINSTQISTSTPPAPTGSDGSGGIGDIIGGLMGGSGGSGGIEEVIEGLLGGLTSGSTGGSSGSGDAFGDFISGLMAGQPIGDLIESLLASLIDENGGISNIIAGLPSPFSKRDGNSSDSDSSDPFGDFISGLIAGDPIGDLIETLLASLIDESGGISNIIAALPSPFSKRDGSDGNSTEIDTAPVSSDPFGDFFSGLIAGDPIGDLIEALIANLIGGSGGISDIIAALPSSFSKRDGNSTEIDTAPVSSDPFGDFFSGLIAGDPIGDLIEALLSNLLGEGFSDIIANLPSPFSKRDGNSSETDTAPVSSDPFGDFFSGLIAGDPIGDLIESLLANLIGGSGGISDIIAGLSSSFSKRDGSGSSGGLAALLGSLGGSGSSGSGGLAYLLGSLGSSGSSGSGGLASLLAGLGSSGSSGSGGLASLLGSLGGSGSSGSGSSGSGGLGDILGGLAGTTTNDLVDNKGCKDNILIFARGTTEGGNMGSIVGPLLQKSLEQLLPGKFMFQGVTYPASISSLMDMGSAGGKVVTQLIATTRTQCPDTTIFLSGYSQGAMVMHGGAKNADAAAKQKIGGIVLYGDPFNGQAISGIDASKIKTYCAEGDKVCDMQFIISSAHLSYSGTDTTAGAKFIASKIAA